MQATLSGSPAAVAGRAAVADQGYKNNEDSRDNETWQGALDETSPSYIKLMRNGNVKLRCWWADQTGEKSSEHMPY